MLAILMLFAVSVPKTYTAVAFTSLDFFQIVHPRRKAHFTSTNTLDRLRDNTISCDESSLFATYPNIEISQVQSNGDILSLADLRYQEWILADSSKHNNDASSENEKPSTTPSRASFRLATAEIYQERKAEGSLVFLARYHNRDCRDVDGQNACVVVGAVELSPIETRYCIYSNNSPNIQPLVPIAMYATDVVTSNSYRRLGIGSRLMMTLEDSAWSLGCRFVFLHVEYDNISAVKFYHGLGYLDVVQNDSLEDDVDVISLSFTKAGIFIWPVRMTPSTNNASDELINGMTRTKENDNMIITLKKNQLAINAGTVGQLLMVKQLEAPRGIDEYDKITSANAISRVKETAGFGKRRDAGRFTTKNGREKQ